MKRRKVCIIKQTHRVVDIIMITKHPLFSAHGNWEFHRHWSKAVKPTSPKYSRYIIDRIAALTCYEPALPSNDNNVDFVTTSLEVGETPPERAQMFVCSQGNLDDFGPNNS
jgi:hypothetical protein